MIKIDILNRENLTLLAKAYLDKLFPMAKSGEIFYDVDNQNEVKSIYLLNSDYYRTLIEHIGMTRHKFMASNAATGWENLFNVLSSYTIVDQTSSTSLLPYGIALQSEGLRNESSDSDSSFFFEIIKGSKQVDLFKYSEDWIDIDCSQEYKESLIECIKYIRPEMYFNYLLRLIIKYDFENKGEQIPPNDNLLRLFQEASRKILNEECGILTSDDSDKDTFLSFQWQIHHVNYSKEVDALLKSTQNYINYSEHIRKSLNIDSHENPYTSQKSMAFFHTLMYIGLRMAYTRISNDLENKSIIGAELVSHELKLYLTPEGLRNLSQIERLTSKERWEIFNKFSEDYKIKIIESKALQSHFDASIILEYQSNLYHNYKIYGNYLNTYMSNRINNKPLASLWTESQSNYKKANF